MNVSKHAIARWLERAGSDNPERAKRKILTHLSGARPIGGRRWYAAGWVFVVDGETVVTVMRPRKREVFDAIHRAANESS